MAKSKTRQNQDAPWSDLTHDMLFVIMMKVDVVDFLAFSGVCKSWRSLALSNKNKFMESRPPMSIWIRHRAFREDCCYLQDSNGRKIKISLRHSGGRTLIGLTCGYLILFGKKTRDFWLVNPITRHGLHFPALPFFDDTPERARAILVFSPLISRWVFVMAPRYSYDIWFFIAGKGAWNHFTYDDFIMDIHAFKGKIYMITCFNKVCELRLNSEPKVTLLKTKYVTDINFKGKEIVSFGENLYVIGRGIRNEYTVLELDTKEMTWVQPKNTIGHDYLVSVLKHGDYVFKQSDCDCPPQYAVYAYFHDESRKEKLYKMWYYTHDCMNVDIIYT